MNARMPELKRAFEAAGFTEVKRRVAPGGRRCSLGGMLTTLRATLALFRHLPAAAWSRRGTANNRPVSVRALASIIAGHTRHHLEVVEARYLE